MTDNRYKWTVGVAVITILVVAAMIIFTPNKNTKVDYHEEDLIGKYIYRDDNDVHHINPNCLKLRRGNDDGGHNIYAKHMMDTAEFIIIKPEFFRVCSRCVNDREYEHILQISNRNSQ